MWVVVVCRSFGFLAIGIIAYLRLLALFGGVALAFSLLLCRPAECCWVGEAGDGTGGKDERARGHSKERAKQNSSGFGRRDAMDFRDLSGVQEVL